MGIKDLTASMVLAGISIFLVLLFAGQFQSVNNAETTFADNNDTNNLQNDLGVAFSNYSDDANAINTIYYNTTLKEGQDGFLIPSQNIISTKSQTTPFGIIKTSLTYAYRTMIGNNGSALAYVFNALVGLLSTIIIYFIIRFIRTGQE